eukprot:TRINITY_DN10272_c0_g1_i2.p1 TRINITY_DN10272_c0_g1~~TRINITY_DN10272_c0_g1_i2.p1  ORF type:complete len:1025 (+),score=341.73 TRINITY_DN10272_c0_g1_i2:399-3077(+)
MAYRDAAAYRKDHVLSIVHQVNKMTEAPATQHALLDVLSVDTLVNWVSIGYLLVPHDLQAEEVQGLVSRMLTDGFALTLHGTETLAIHAAYDATISGLKEGKKMNKIKSALLDQVSAAVNNAPAFHAQRRSFLRNALHQLLALLTEQPGLINPQLLVVLRGLAMAKDEVNWLLRHRHSPLPKKTKLNPRVFDDPELPQLLSHAMELKQLLHTHSKMVERYHSDLLTGFDSAAIRECTTQLQMSQRESAVVEAFINTLFQMSEGTKPDLRGFRLDWLRLQASMACKSSRCPIVKCQPVAAALNAAVLHTLMVDDREYYVRDLAVPRLFAFYNKTLRNTFDDCLKNPAQARYALGMVQICDGFTDNATDFDPHERERVTTESLNLAKTFVDSLTTRAAQTLHQLATAHVEMASALTPELAVPSLIKQKATNDDLPGSESHKHAPSEMSNRLSSLQALLADLCWALNHHQLVPIATYEFSPREFLAGAIRTFVSKTLPQLIGANASPPPRPSVVLLRVKAFLAAIRSVENYVNMDVSQLFATSLLDQSKLGDANFKTLASIYMSFYLELLFKHGVNGDICHSESRRCLVTVGQAPVAAHEYTDARELQALCSLIGPYGIKQLNDHIMARAGNIVADMKQVVIKNPKLMEIAMHTDRASACDDALRALQGVEQFVQQGTFIGMVLEFRAYLQQALAAVLQDRIPFVFQAIKGMHQTTKGSSSVDLLALTAGISSNVDPQLVSTMHQFRGAPETEYQNWMLFMAMFAVGVRHIALSTNYGFKAGPDVFERNALSLATAANMLSAAVFTLCSLDGQQAATVQSGQDTFVRVAGTLLMRMEASNEGKNRRVAYALLAKMVDESPFFTADLLEDYVPATLIRSAHHYLFTRRETNALFED